MDRSKRVRRGVGKLFRSGTLGIAAGVLLLGSGQSWAGPPNPTPSDANQNTAGGSFALVNNTTGAANTAFGTAALGDNTTGFANTASGSGALLLNTTGADNTAGGIDAPHANTEGNGNTASGDSALLNNTKGNDNTAIGLNAGLSNTMGNNSNTFIGSGADANAGIYTNGTALGYEAQLTASNSIVLGNRSISRIFANVTTAYARGGF